MASHGSSLGQSTAFGMPDPWDIALKQAQVKAINANTAKIESETLTPGTTQRAADDQHNTSELNQKLLEARVFSEQTKQESDAYDLYFRQVMEGTIKSVEQAKLNNIQDQNKILHAQLRQYDDEHSKNPYLVKEIQSRIFKNNMETALIKFRAEHTEQEFNTDLAYKLAQTDSIETATAMLREEVKSIPDENRRKKALADIEEAEAVRAKYGNTWLENDAWKRPITSLVQAAGYITHTVVPLGAKK